MRTTGTSSTKSGPYGSVSTGYRTPVYNARAGTPGPLPNDLVIPQGASSDKLVNYELGLKGRWLNGRLTAALAAYYIDWSNIQVQANRVSDSAQFATNIGGAYNYKLGGNASGFTSFQIQHVGSFPNMFPNTPGTLGTRSPLYGFTDAYTHINLQSGVTIGELNVTLYVENLTNSRKTTYIHPEAFVYSRYGILRPRTFGIRIGYNLW